MGKYKDALTVRQLIDFLEMIENKDKKIMVTSLGNFNEASPVIKADSVEITTNGIPGVYLCVED